MSVFSAPFFTISCLFSSFLKANVRSAPAAARWTFWSLDESSYTNGGIPISRRTFKTGKSEQQMKYGKRQMIGPR